MTCRRKAQYIDSSHEIEIHTKSSMSGVVVLYDAVLILYDDRDLVYIIIRERVVLCYKGSTSCLLDRQSDRK